MFELREFDLQLALLRARALREDVENQRSAIEDLALENLFQVARLRPAQFVIENDGIDAILLAFGSEFRGLARANERARERPFQLLRRGAGDDAAGGLREFGEFLERVLN